MDLLFVIDPIKKLKIKKDSTIEIMRSAFQQGHRIWVCEISDLSISRQQVFANTSHIVLEESNVNWYQTLTVEKKNLLDFSFVLMRKDPPVDLPFIESLWILRQAKYLGVKVINDPDILLGQNEKLGILDFPELISPTCVTSQLDEVQSFHQQHGDIILKPLNEMGGSGVFRITSDGVNLGACWEVLSQGGKKPVMVQRYIPAVVDGDKRILIIAGQVMKYGLARIPKKGETRANLAAGGTGVAKLLSDRERYIAETIAHTLMKKGIYVAGLDVIGDFLTEINITSPTCLVEIREQTGFSIATELVKSLSNA